MSAIRKYVSGGTANTPFLSVITLTLITEQEVPKMEGLVIRGTYQSDEALSPPLPSRFSRAVLSAKSQD